MTPSWWVFWAAVVVAVRTAGTQRAIANYEERWRMARHRKRERWGEK